MLASTHIIKFKHFHPSVTNMWQCVVRLMTTTWTQYNNTCTYTMNYQYYMHVYVVLGIYLCCLNKEISYSVSITLRRCTLPGYGAMKKLKFSVLHLIGSSCLIHKLSVRNVTTHSRHYGQCSVCMVSMAIHCIIVPSTVATETHDMYWSPLVII